MGAGTSSPVPWLLFCKCLSVANLGVVAVLFVTAGALVQAGELIDIHGVAAIALHVTSGVLTLTLAGLARSRRHGWWAAGLAFALFVFSFVQAYLGEGPTLDSHVPGALAVTIASVWLVSWLFGRDRVKVDA
jgi:hypothetical protein